MADGPPVKYKRRRVSAIRHFPKGCGPNAPKLADLVNPAEETHPVLVSAAKEVSLPHEKAASDRTGLEESLKVLNGESVDLIVGDGSAPSEAVGGEEKMEVEVGKAQELVLKMYPPPRRRKVSAIRTFPAGCGSKAPPLMKALEDESLIVRGNENVELDGRIVENTGSRLVDPATHVGKSMEAEEKHNGKEIECVEKVNEDEIGLDTNDSSNAKSAEGVQKLVVKPRDNSREFGSSSVVLKVGDVDGRKLESDSEICRDGAESPKVSNVDGDQKLDVKPGDNDKVVGSASVVQNDANVDVLKKLALKQKVVDESSDQVVVPAGEVEVEKRGNGSKQAKERTSENMGLVCVRSLENIHSRENVAEGEGKKMTLDRSVLEKKMEVNNLKHDAKSPKLGEQENKPFQPDATSPSRIKIVDRDASGLPEREEDNRCLMIRKNTKKLARKSLVRSEEKSIVLRAQEQEDLVSYADRLIIQALTSAENCPWKQGKKPIKSRSQTVQALTSAENSPWKQGKKPIKSRSQTDTPKNKVKRNGKASGKLSAGVASSQGTSLVAVNDEDGSLHWEDEIRQALVAHKKTRQFDVTLTPLGPSMPCPPESGGNEGVVTRNRVKKTLRLFQVIVRKLLQREESKRADTNRSNRIDLMAANILKEHNEWVNKGKNFVGVVPGVEVGDEFHYRVELSIIGLHRPFQGGIDATKLGDINVATSIVASGGYPDDIDSSESSDVLIYSGSGGNPQKGEIQGSDQKLERGNLALKNSIETKTPVRVIYGFKETKASESHDSKPKLVSTFTYDGLYLVESYWKERGKHGDVFKFRLRRIPGQPDIGLKEVKKSKKLKEREGLCVKDISNGKEIIPICVINNIDSDQPLPFKYITKVIAPSWYIPTPPVGCECTNGCIDSDKCACAFKNGGEIPYNFSGAIIQAKPLVYECGPSCKCPPSCTNRVSQHGIKIPLEVFKTRSRGWGVRSLSSIQSGSFICEYIGELLQESEAEQRCNDEYLFDIGHNYDDQALWEGLPTLIPALQSNPLGEVKEDSGFTIDAADCGNVGRFINHSCSPNLYAQNVLYDHDDKRIPHIMFFAADNIPPLQELTYHYNYTIDQVRDSEGNIKRKDCYCGAPDCTGRLY
ncbi:histone H3-K9 methyltransferase plant protein [Dioscorea alata]|uniref:Histone H3-K9 methyltransferase plant protein n=2 Tax=Dioscorea alata TaxID=55571 RepID=A0ACB7TV37_DIOAL|nr:histone H3-K9 methyltransferase plant protein [Dioscorea alata]KAH7651931.1 histone H3-K9 methyltransferase plant protein [Dioscorea alata]